MKNVRVVAPHTPDDEMNLKGYHECVCLGRPHDAERRSKDGRRIVHGWYIWLRYVCNNPDCSGEAWVSKHEIDVAAGAMIDKVLA